MPLTGLMTEALLLGVFSGPVCLASCSPVLVPVLAAGQRSPRGTSALLAQFLTGRLAGYEQIVAGLKADRSEFLSQFPSLSGEIISAVR